MTGGTIVADGVRRPGKRLAVAAASVVMLFLAAGAGHASVERGVLRIGIVTDMSGPYADGNGTGSVIAAQMAVEDFGGKVLGVPIEIVSADHQDKPDIGAAIVRQWIDEKGVDVIAEGVNSAVALAIQSVTRDKGKIFLISGSGTSDLTGKACSPTGVHWTYDTYASANTTAKAVVARGGDSWYFLTADYAFGQALERDASATVVKAGGTVVGDARHPFNTGDFSSFLLQAQASSAKIVALANAGSDFINATKQAAEFHLQDSGKQLVALQVTLTDVPTLGLAAAQGLMFTDSYYWDLNDQTRAWSKRFFARHGAMPTSYQAGVASAIGHYLKAVQAAGTDDAAKVMAKMRELPVNDFFTTGGKVRADGRMVHDMYLMRIKKPSESKSKWDLYERLATVAGDDAFRPLSESACPYLAK
jgi:branched-chain amino acid transport system substrate-binding protein